MLFVVMLVALLIGGLSTMNTMMMTVFERTREIGLMKAIGGSRRHIFGLFLFEGVTICLAGGGIGVAVGSAATLMGDFVLKQFVSVMPTRSVGQLSWQAAAASILFPLAIGVLSSLYPALKAAGQDPMVALRTE
jgi:putative ABC transport system permease protein